MRRLLVVAIALACACGSKDSGSSGAKASPEHAADLAPNRLLDDLAMLTTGRAPSEALRKAVAGGETLDAAIDQLLREPDFARTIVPTVLLGELKLPPLSYPIGQMLQTAEVGGTTLYFLRKQCDLKDAVVVAPWWDAKNPVHICTADYQPDVLVTKDGHYCSGSMARNYPECGCGKDLMNCLRDSKQLAGFRSSLLNESVDTIAHVVESNEPFSDIFTTQSTFRDRNVEVIHARDRMYLGQIDHMPDLSSWPETGTWAPREDYWPGSQSGILTTTQYMYLSDGPRDRMRLVFARMWCSTPGSFGVTSAQFRELVGNHANIRSSAEGWQQLAAAPGCTDCHARMDYGMQFFSGYPASGTSATPILAASRHAEKGQLYQRDIKDPRGEAPLTPHAFGELAVAQPEFASCMATRVSDHVLGPAATPDDIAALEDVFKKTGRIQPMFATALRTLVKRPAPAAVASPAVAKHSVGENVDVPATLAATLEERCGDCHDDGEHGWLGKIGETHTLPRPLMLQIGNYVAAGLMPQDHPLAEREAGQLLSSVVDAMAPDEEWARNARSYFVDGFRGSRVHVIASVAQRVADITGAKLPPLNDAESALEGNLLTLTPSYVSEVSRVAVAACQPLLKDDARYRECLKKTLRPDVLTLSK